MGIPFELLCTVVIVGLCSALPTPSDVASTQAPSVHIAASSEEVSWNVTVPEEDAVLEGDIVIDSEVVPLVEFRSGHSVRNLVADPRLLWPDRTVFYQLPAGAPGLAAAVGHALGQIMAVSCVRFAPRPPGQRTYLKLRATGKGCATKVGYHEEEGELDLHVGGTKCHSRGTIQHEFLHALGFWHEHTRPDRDRHVSVVWDNVKSDYKMNFLKRSEMESLNLGLPYDYASVMHYKYTSFAKHRGTPTLVPKVKEAVKVMGQRRGITWVDVAKLNRLYNCSEEFYRGEDLKDGGAVFGQVVEPRKENPNSDKFENQTFTKKLNSSNHNELLIETNTPKLEVTVSKIDNEGKNDEEIFNGIKWWVLEFMELLNLRDKSLISERVAQFDVGNHHKTKREALVDNPQPSTSKGEMSVQTTQNGGHEHFEPQRILPELLKGVLNSDSNNERPIVIQFAIYQPVIYKSENKTDNPDEGSKKLKQSEISDGIIDEKRNISEDKNKLNTAQESNRQDKYSSISQEPYREHIKTNLNSQEFTEDENHNHDLQSQHDLDAIGLRTASDVSYNGGYRGSSSSQLSSLLRGPNNKEDIAKTNLSASPDYSEIDRRTPYDRRTEHGSSFKISQKERESLQSTSVDYEHLHTHPETPGSFEIQDFPPKRIASIPKSELTQPPRSPVINSEYMMFSSMEQDPPFKLAIIHDEQTKVSQKDLAPFSPSPKIKGDELIPIEKKTVPFYDSFASVTEEPVVQMPKVKYSEIGEHFHDVKDVYGPINHRSDEKSQIPHAYEIQEKEEHVITSSPDIVPSRDIARGNYHSSEAKIEEHEDLIPPILDNEPRLKHITSSKDDLLSSSDTYVSSSFNMNVDQIGSNTQEKVSVPRVAKPLPAKSTEIPLDLEVGPPKMAQPLIGNGDGENVAPNWKGVIENEDSHEKPQQSVEESINVDSWSRPDVHISTDRPPVYNRPDEDDTDNRETKQVIRPTRRPDLVTDEDRNEELDKEIRRLRLEKKLQEEESAKRLEKIMVTTTMRGKSEVEISKDIIVPRRIPVITKVLSPPAPSLPTMTRPKKPSNHRREVQEEDVDSIDLDEDLNSKPNMSRVNLNPRQALPLNANATIKMSIQKLFRKERN